MVAPAAPQSPFFQGCCHPQAKSCSPGLPDPCRSPVCCRSPAIDILSLSIQQKCQSHALLPMGLDFPHPGLLCPVAAPEWEQSWVVALLDLSVLPQSCSQGHGAQHKVPPGCLQQRACQRWAQVQQGAGRSDPRTLSSLGRQQGSGLAKCSLGLAFCSEQPKARQTDCCNARLFFAEDSFGPGQRQSQ